MVTGALPPPTTLGPLPIRPGGYHLFREDWHVWGGPLQTEEGTGPESRATWLTRSQGPTSGRPMKPRAVTAAGASPFRSGCR